MDISLQKKIVSVVVLDFHIAMESAKIRVIRRTGIFMIVGVPVVPVFTRATIFMGVVPVLVPIGTEKGIMMVVFPTVKLVLDGIPSVAVLRMKFMSKAVLPVMETGEIVVRKHDRIGMAVNVCRKGLCAHLNQIPLNSQRD